MRTRGREVCAGDDQEFRSDVLAGDRDARTGRSVEDLTEGRDDIQVGRGVADHDLDPIARRLALEPLEQDRGERKAEPGKDEDDRRDAEGARAGARHELASRHRGDIRDGAAREAAAGGAGGGRGRRGVVDHPAGPDAGGVAGGVAGPPARWWSSDGGRPTRSMKISSIDGSAIRKFVTRSP